MKTAGIIFMGGKARRLGGVDKAAQLLSGRTLFDHVHAALSQSVNEIAISVASPAQRPAQFHGPVILDAPPPDNQNNKGGLALALLASLGWAKDNGFDSIITSPVDTPFLPQDFASKLISIGQSSNTSAYCTYNGHLHGLHSFWKTSQLSDLTNKIHDLGMMKINTLHKELGSDPCLFDDEIRDPFFNINTADDLETARRSHH